MPPPPPRRLWLRVFQNFMRSLTPGYVKSSSEGGGTYVGDDYLGNKYYEKPADSSRGRQHPTRYFEVPDRDSYSKENLPAEWDSWLRNRRRLPPTEDELKRNLQIAMLKKQNALKLGATPELPQSKTNFPAYEEYEVNPGEKSKAKDLNAK